MILPWSYVQFAHEIGHNCGAEHDPDTIYCSPADDDDGAGKYIMFAAATDGTKVCITIT